MEKHGTAFWKCWRSKFEPNKRQITQVDGINDAGIWALSLNILHHILKEYAPTAPNWGQPRLKSEYLSKRSQYQGQPFIKDYAIDAELVENVIRKMKRDKAADLEGITCEHLIFSHALLPCILAKFFNLMINISYVPLSFDRSCTVPILKSNCNVYGKIVTVDDSRGVSVSPVISKVFEHCVLDRCGAFLVVVTINFGSKKPWLCQRCIRFTARCYASRY